MRKKMSLSSHTTINHHRQDIRLGEMWKIYGNSTLKDYWEFGLIKSAWKLWNFSGSFSKTVMINFPRLKLMLITVTERKYFPVLSSSLPPASQVISTLRKFLAH